MFFLFFYFFFNGFPLYSCSEHITINIIIINIIIIIIIITITIVIIDISLGSIYKYNVSPPYKLKKI